jgi:hypothetical protein
MTRMTQNMSRSTTTPFATHVDFVRSGYYDPATLELNSLIGLPRWRERRANHRRIVRSRSIAVDHATQTRKARRPRRNAPDRIDADPFR